ncbi:hypothetical protein L1987_23664 [Smallanthus sonchifolius]|uniref:Uncharacterized protein n=1 Tax=Smallanthus sonchifolius TaxID=185202 RepID=A0ACB9IJR6_9ASTR|nr:hypothetical protein L1987_23664 [Smallanthus sonchifolius]
MAIENRTISDFAKPSLEALGSSITSPTVDANNFEIKSHVIHMIQSSCTFHGLPDEDPHAHIANLLEICDTFKLNGVSNDAILLRMEDSESLYEAWECFKDMLRKCPHHRLEVWLQVSSFYNGLQNQARQTLDATAGGIFGNKRPQEAYNLIEEIAMNSYQWYNPRNTMGARQGVHSVDTVTSLSNQVDALTTRLNQLSKGKTAAEATEEVKSITTNTEQVEFIGTNRLQNNPYSNTYNHGWRNHPNFSWKDKNNQGQSGFGQQQQQFQKRPPQNYQSCQQFQGTSKPSNGLSLEDAVTKLISTTESQALLAGQIAKLLSERQPGCLPSNTETNPKVNVSAITLRNSKVYPEPPIPEEEVQSTRREIFTGVPLRPPTIETTTQESQSKVTPPPAPVDTPPKDPTKRTFHSHIPYPGRLVKQKTDEQYEKFNKLLSQIHVNLPFLDIIQQMPKYGHFLKDFLTNKRNMEEAVKRTNHCVALIERCLLKKLSDPGKFSLPCSIGPLPITFAIADLGASVNVMPYVMFKRLSIGNPRPVNATIELADGSVKSPIGVIENSLVKVGKFVFPADFMVLEMGPDYSMSLILGRPFLATAQAVIDMNEGILTLCAGKQSVTYNIGGNECLSNDPFEIAQFNDTNLDYQLKKAKEFNKRKKLNLGKDFENIDWIDEYFDKLPKLKDLNEGT